MHIWVGGRNWIGGEVVKGGFVLGFGDIRSGRVRSIPAFLLMVLMNTVDNIIVGEYERAHIVQNLTVIDRIWIGW